MPADIVHSATVAHSAISAIQTGLLDGSTVKPELFFVIPIAIAMGTHGHLMILIERVPPPSDGTVTVSSLRLQAGAGGGCGTKPTVSG